MNINPFKRKNTDELNSAPHSTENILYSINIEASVFDEIFRGQGYYINGTAYIPSPFLKPFLIDDEFFSTKTNTLNIKQAIDPNKTYNVLCNQSYVGILATLLSGCSHYIFMLMEYASQETNRLDRSGLQLALNSLKNTINSLSDFCDDVECLNLEYFTPIKETVLELLEQLKKLYKISNQFYSSENIDVSVIKEMCSKIYINFSIVSAFTAKATGQSFQYIKEIMDRTDN